MHRSALIEARIVKEEVAENREAARAVRIGGAATKDGLPGFCLAKVLQRGMKSRSHRLP